MDENMTEYDNDMSVAEWIDKELKAIYAEMNKLDRSSQEYGILNDRAIALSEQKRNIDQADVMRGQKWAPYLQSIGSVVGAAIGGVVSQMFNRRTVNDVLDSEKEGHIVTSKATNFMQKPRG